MEMLHPLWSMNLSITFWHFLYTTGDRNSTQWNLWPPLRPMSLRCLLQASPVEVSCYLFLYLACFFTLPGRCGGGQWWLTSSGTNTKRKITGFRLRWNTATRWSLQTVSVGWCWLMVMAGFVASLLQWPPEQSPCDASQDCGGPCV